MATQNYRDPADGLFKSISVSGAEEVHVGPNPPTDPNIEWWIDTDDTTGQGISVVDADARYVAKVANVPTGFRNVLRNGDMQIAQRGDSFTTGLDGANGYTLDGWWPYTNPAGTTIQRVALTPGMQEARYAMQITVTGQAGAANYAAIGTYLENSTMLQGQVVTLSFMAKVNTGTAQLQTWAGSYLGAGGTHPPNLIFTPVTIDSTLKRYTMTGTMPSHVGKTMGAEGSDYYFMEFSLSDGGGNGTSLGLQNKTFTITDVQLEAGPTATPFERLPIQQQLAWCQRYFWRVGQFSNDGVSFYSGSWFRFATGVARSGNVIDCVIPYPVPMRAVPSVTFTAPSTFAVWNGSASTVCSAVGIGDCMSNVSANIFATSSAAAAQATVWQFLVNAGAAGYIDFAAEF